MAEERLPEDWLEPIKDGMRVKYSQRKKLPEAVILNTAGKKSMMACLSLCQNTVSFCLNCGVTYSGRELSDFGKLATLSSEGRSTSTTILEPFGITNAAP